MIDTARTRKLPLLLALLAVLSLASCLFDKPEEKVELTLSKVPAGTDRIRVVAVDRQDTSKVLGVVFEGAWASGRPLAFSLDKASGKDWLLRVEGYQGDYLVYRARIPSGKSGADSAVHEAVNGTWPAVVITAVRRDGDSVRITTAFRAVPDGLHWHLNLGADSLGDTKYTPIFNREFALAASAIDPGSIMTAELRREDHTRFPVQEPDTLLGDEARAPSGSEVQIADAYRDGDSVRLTLAYKKFRVPLVDEPTPGQGFPMVHEAGSLRIVPGFRMKDGDDIINLSAPASALSGIKTLVVALHYANQMRIRPAVADTLEAATALSPRVLLPTLKIASHSIQGNVLTLVLERGNFQGFHVHIYRERIQWPGSTAYQLCHAGTCEVGAGIWQGAKQVVVSVQRDGTHELLQPIVGDSLAIP